MGPWLNQSYAITGMVYNLGVALTVTSRQPVHPKSSGSFARSAAEYGIISVS